MSDIDEEKRLVVEDLGIGKFERVERADRPELHRPDQASRLLKRLADLHDLRSRQAADQALTRAGGIIRRAVGREPPPVADDTPRRTP